MNVELVRAPLPWHKDPKELAQLWRWLDEQGRTPDDPAYFMDKAVKWTPEHEEFLRDEAQARLADEEAAFEDQQRYAP
jgi:hypothetical protein